MKRRIAIVTAGIIAFFLSLALILYFDPFTAFFDRIFTLPDDGPMSLNTEFSIMWHDDDELEEHGEIRNIAENYFECFYYSLGDKDFDGDRIMEGFFVDSCDDCVYDRAAVASCSVRLREAAVDLSLSDVKVHLTVENLIKINNNGYILTLDQSAELVYKRLSNMAGGEGIYRHTFVFESINGSWYITSHQCGGGAWGHARQLMNRLCGTTMPEYSALYGKFNDFCSRTEKSAKSTAELISLKGYGSFPTPEIQYNREAAVEYALKWSSAITEMRNTGEWEDYESDSGNFVSQCIYSGVGEMDVKGNYIWKWFDSSVNYSNPAAGCSMSWTEGDNFWLYCTGNDRMGLDAYTGIAGGQLEKGDVVQLMIGDSVRTQVIVTDVVTDRSGNKLEFLVNGHDDDLTNYPLSMLHCDGVRLIKILGFNKD